MHSISYSALSGLERSNKSKPSKVKQVMSPNPQTETYSKNPGQVKLA
jgi:hypothetical protein